MILKKWRIELHSGDHVSYSSFCIIKALINQGDLANFSYFSELKINAFYKPKSLSLLNRKCVFNDSHFFSRLWLSLNMAARVLDPPGLISCTWNIFFYPCHQNSWLLTLTLTILQSGPYPTGGPSSIQRMGSLQVWVHWFMVSILSVLGCHLQEKQS